MICLGVRNSATRYAQHRGRAAPPQAAKWSAQVAKYAEEQATIAAEATALIMQSKQKEAANNMLWEEVHQAAQVPPPPPAPLFPPAALARSVIPAIARSIIPGGGLAAAKNPSHLGRIPAKCGDALHCAEPPSF